MKHFAMIIGGAIGPLIYKFLGFHDPLIPVIALLCMILISLEVKE